MHLVAVVALLISSVILQTATARDLKVHLISQQLPQSGKGRLHVALADAATGKPLPSDSNVTLKSITTPSGAESADQLLEPDSDGTWGADFFRLHKQLGVYTLAISATSGSSHGSISSDVYVTGRVEVSDMKATVETTTSRDTQPMVVGQPLPETLLLPSGFSAKAVFTFTVTQSDGSGFRPHQAMIRAVHVGTGAAVFVRGKAADDGYHRLTLSAADFKTQAEGRGGLYNLTLLVADAAIENPTQWTFGQINVSSGAELSPISPAVKPEIRHVFRPADKRTNPIISIIFAAFQVAALVGLLAVLLRITGGKLRGLPQTSRGWLAAVAFHGCLLAMLGLLLAFWVRLTILQLIPLMAVAGPVTAGCGYLLLSHLATAQYLAARAQLKTS